MPALSDGRWCVRWASEVTTRDRVPPRRVSVRIQGGGDFTTGDSLFRVPPEEQRRPPVADSRHHPRRNRRQKCARHIRWFSETNLLQAARLLGPNENQAANQRETTTSRCGGRRDGGGGHRPRFRAPQGSRVFPGALRGR